MRITSVALLLTDGGLLWVALVTAFYYVLLITSMVALVLHVRRVLAVPLDVLRGSPHLPAVSILVPAYNEQATIVDTVEALLGLDYRDYEVIVINDGSHDDTLPVLIERFGLYPLERQAARVAVPAALIRGTYISPATDRLLVVDTENGGKGRALNAGINASRHPFVCTIDADSLLEPDALLRMARLYMMEPERTVAVGGMVRVGNGCTIAHGAVSVARIPKTLVPTLQAAEYIRTFIGGRIGWASLNTLPVISGAFGLFRRDLLVRVNGYPLGAPGEDMGIVLAIHQYCRSRRQPYRIAYCPDAVCWTQAPETLGVLGLQRRRWARGNLRNMRAYRHLIGRARYGALGLVLFPYLLLVEVLGPYWMVLALAALFLARFQGAGLHALLLLVAVVLLLDILLGWAAVTIDDWTFRRFPARDIFRLYLHMLHMPLWYYMLMAYWRVAGHVQWIRRKNPWGTMGRVSWKA